ncbi:hypothetical protein [Pseudoalteromonas piscicida]|uniref:hypothetical protein n=1 Tax=Pseudoalteromonas piscicida TaxID=43662 RepID=UPI00117A2E42|nr:hypothetical protein [Pseudoalteromonas piscicida]
MTTKILLATAVAVVLMSGCSGKFTTRVSNVPVDCESDSRSCSLTCRKDYSDPMQVQNCEDRCFQQQNQCRVDRPTQDKWEITDESPTYPTSF